METWMDSASSIGGELELDGRGGFRSDLAVSSRVCDENRQGRAGFEQVAMTAVKTRVEVA